MTRNKGGKGVECFSADAVYILIKSKRKEKVHTVASK